MPGGYLIENGKYEYAVQETASLSRDTNKTNPLLYGIDIPEVDDSSGKKGSPSRQVNGPDIDGGVKLRADNNSKKYGSKAGEYILLYSQNISIDFASTVINIVLFCTCSLLPIFQCFSLLAV